MNTHGSILIGLLVLALELGWSLVPARLVQRIGGTDQSRHTGPLALALLGSVVACCLTPYGPGLLAYDISVSRNGQIAQYISEWNSPDFHSPMVVLVYCVPLVVLVACVRLRRIPVLEGSLGAIPLRRGAAHPASGRLPHAGGGGPGRLSPDAPTLGGDGAALGRRRHGGLGAGHPRWSRPSRPAPWRHHSRSRPSIT